MPYTIDLLTLFPGAFPGFLEAGVIGRAIERGLLVVRVHDLREHGLGRHKVVDDAPFGGGAGMVMRPEPPVAAIERMRTAAPSSPVVLLTPQGRPFTQAMGRELSGLPGMVLLCGRYEGVDERVCDFVDREVSIGDYVLSGGEAAAMAIIDAVGRLIPGVLGNQASTAEESFASPCLLEYPQYTRPREFRARRVPEVLLSGDHAAIARWRRAQALVRTRDRRPDMLAGLGDADRELLASLEDDPVSSSRKRRS